MSATCTSTPHWQPSTVNARNLSIMKLYPVVCDEIILDTCLYRLQREIYIYVNNYSNRDVLQERGK